MSDHRSLLSELEAAAGVTFFDYQVEAFEKAVAHATVSPNPRRCLFYKTGAGKSLTALVDMRLWGQRQAVVIAPPSTFEQWKKFSALLGVEVECMSHAKFRMKATRVNRAVPVIADELHMFGGHDGLGWKKLDKMAMHLQAPMILASATPNYNDAERVYCVKHILDPHGTKGGYLDFLYRECETEANPFGLMPKVLGFRKFPEAKDYLASLPYVDYLPDDLLYRVIDIPIPALHCKSMDLFGYNERDHRMFASLIEERHTRTFQSLVTPDGWLVDEAYSVLLDQRRARSGPLLVFSAHATVALAAARTLNERGIACSVLTGKTPARAKADLIARFLSGSIDVLIGTATLATGTDGMDKVCDSLLVLDDTDDDSLRRQLIGRIMPRGAGGSAASKEVRRVLLQ